MNLQDKLTEFQTQHKWLPGSLSYLLGQRWCSEKNLREELQRNVRMISNCPNDTSLGSRTCEEHKFLVQFGVPEDLI